MRRAQRQNGARERQSGQYPHRTGRFFQGVLLAAAALIVWPSLASAAIVHFDDVPMRQVISGDRYRNLGVILSTDPVGPNGAQGQPQLWVVPLPFNGAHTPPNILFASDDPSGGAANMRITADFVSPTGASPAPVPANSVSFRVIDSFSAVAPQDLEFWTAAIYSVDGRLLDSRTDRALTALVTFSRPTADIARLVFTPSRDYEAIDTLMFSTPQVPEPSMLGLAAGGGAWLLLRRRHQAASN